jgi:hypothetical protein
MRINYAQRFYVPFYINLYIEVLTNFGGRECPSLPWMPIASSNPERSDGWVPTIRGHLANKGAGMSRSSYLGT